MISASSRRSLAALSACGIAAGLFVYFESFLGATMGNSWVWLILLAVGSLLVGVPIQRLERRSPRNWMFFRAGFMRGMPSWVVVCNYLLLALFIEHFVAYSVRSGYGVPAIIDGQYVLDSRGKILKVITQAEYLSLQEEGLRVTLSAIIASYFMPMMYWWVPRA
jgi:hypothetical protein